MPIQPTHLWRYPLHCALYLCTFAHRSHDEPTGTAHSLPFSSPGPSITSKPPVLHQTSGADILNSAIQEPQSSSESCLGSTGTLFDETWNNAFMSWLKEIFVLDVLKEVAIDEHCSPSSKPCIFSPVRDAPIFITLLVLGVCFDGD